jgi:hypothetical protein
MAFRNKSKSPQATPLTELESTLQAKIEEVEKIEDPIDRLLEYKALRDATTGTFDQGKADSRSRAKFKGAEIAGDYLGFFSGVGGGIAGGTALAATVLTGGLAAVAIVPGVAVLVGATFAGHRLGKRFDQRRFNNRTKKFSPEAKQATNMFVMTQGMDRTIKGLSSNLQAIAQSPRKQEVLDAFPDIAAEFNRQAKNATKQADIAARQAAFLGQPNPAANAQILKPAAAS